MNVKKNDPQYAAYKKLTSPHRYTQIESENLEKYMQAYLKTKQKKAGSAILISDKRDSKPKTEQTDKE